MNNSVHNFLCLYYSLNVPCYLGLSLELLPEYIKLKLLSKAVQKLIRRVIINNSKLIGNPRIFYPTHYAL